MGWFCDARLEFFPRFARLDFFLRFLRARKNCVLKEAHVRVLHTSLRQGRGSPAARATAFGLRLPRACPRLVWKDSCPRMGIFFSRTKIIGQISVTNFSNFGGFFSNFGGIFSLKFDNSCDFSPWNLITHAVYVRSDGFAAPDRFDLREYMRTSDKTAPIHHFRWRSQLLVNTHPDTSKY